MLVPQPGIAEYQEPGLVSVPGGQVQMAGGNLIIRRTDLSIDTSIGTYDLEQVYNSVNGAWLWNFDMSFDGSTFVDPNGTIYSVAGIPDGGAIPGTFWIKVDGSAVRTRGGLEHRFDAQGRLWRTYWTSNPTIRMEIDRQPSSITIRRCMTDTSCNTFYTITLDAAGRVHTITDYANRQARYDYDAAGRLAQARDGFDMANGLPGFRYEYTDGRLTAMTNSENERIEYDSGFYGETLAVRPIGEENPVWSFSYANLDLSNQYVRVATDPTGVETEYVYTAQRQLLRRSLLASGDTTTWSWSGLRPVSRTEPDQTTTVMVWSGEDLVQEIEPSGNVRTYTYAPNATNRSEPKKSAILRIEDSLGLVEERTYDAAGKLTSRSNGAGETFQLEYTPFDQLRRIVRPDGTSKLYGGELGIWNVHGHPKGIELGFSSGVHEAIVYDRMGNRIQGHDGITPTPGGVVRRTYDADRNVTAIHVASTSETGPVTSEETVTIDHRSDHRRLRVLRPGGADHEFEYDDLGRLYARHERVDGAWQSTTFEYDAAGRRTARTRPNGMREEWTYDASGRLVSIVARRFGVEEGRATFTWADGRIVEIDDTLRGGVHTITYDGAGREETVAFEHGESIVMDYDLRSRPIQADLLLPGGGLLRSIASGYDAAGRVDEIRDGGLVVFEEDFVDGRSVEQRFGNGLVRTYAYDPEDGSPLGSETRAGPGGTLVAQTTISVNEGSSGFLSSVTTLATTTYGTLERTTIERYELGATLGRETKVNDTVGKRVFRWTDDSDEDAWAYDGLSNPTGGQGNIYTYNAEGNRLLGYYSADLGATRDYAYDSAGFVIERNGRTITWNAFGKIASWGSRSFQWDMLGRLMGVAGGGSFRDYSWFGGLVERSGSGSFVALDLEGIRIDLGNGSRRYRHLDIRGNVKFVTSDSGNVILHHQYGPWSRTGSWGFVNDTLTFDTRDEVEMLMLFDARVYDRAIGRFLSPDPIFNVLNQYAYAQGNPLWFEDRDGRGWKLEAAKRFVKWLAKVTGVIGAEEAVESAIESATSEGEGDGSGSDGGGGESGDGDGGDGGGDGGGGSDGGGSGNGGDGGGGGGSAGPGSTSSSGSLGTISSFASSIDSVSLCSPTHLGDLPSTAGWLAALVPLQVLLAVAVLRQRRRDR